MSDQQTSLPSTKRITAAVRDMLAIIEDEHATEAEKSAAAATIREAVAPDIMERAYPTRRQHADQEPVTTSGAELPTEPGFWFYGPDRRYLVQRNLYGLYALPLSEDGELATLRFGMSAIPRGNWHRAQPAVEAKQ